MKTVWTQVAQGYTRWEKYVTATEGAEATIASSGISFLLWRLYQHFWLVCLLFPIVSLVQKPPRGVLLFLAVLALVFFAASYTWLMWPHPASSRARTRSRSHVSFILFVVLVALILVLSLTYGLSFLWLFIGTSAIAGVLLPARKALLALTGLMVLPLIVSVGVSEGVARVDWLQLIPLILLVRGLGLDMIGVARLSSAIRELHTTRRELARLKVEEERQRLARDLHDLLGQTLSMITLKSELARHLIAEDAERCAQELSEIEQAARQTLREVREAVSGYRQPRLESELDAARQLLEAAGINYQIDPIKGALPPDVDAALAWTVREGVTNIIRHSRAQHCLIRLTQKHGTVEVAVINDGDDLPQAESANGQGFGLAGLRERVSALGGHLEVGALTLSGTEHFRVHVELPLQGRGAAQAGQGDRA